MVNSIVSSYSFISSHISWILYNHDLPVISSFIPAYRAKLFIRQGTATFAVAYAVSCSFYTVGKSIGTFLLFINDVISQALCRLRTDTGKSGKLLHQFIHIFGKIFH